MSSSTLKVLGELGDEIVTIQGGPESNSKKFIIHKKLICEKVDFFRKAFTGGFKENEDTMVLVDEKPGMFSIFVDWLYRSEVTQARNKEQFANLCNLYIFAEKICLGGLAVQTMDSIRISAHGNQKTASISLALAAFIYRHTKPSSILRVYCVNEVAYRLWDGKDHSSIPSPELLLDLHNHWRDQGDLFYDYLSYLRENPYEVDIPWFDLADDELHCHFHSHGEDEACSAKVSNHPKHAAPPGQFDESLSFED